MIDLLDKEALDLSRALVKGTLSAQDLMAATLDAIADRNPDVNAIVSLGERSVLMSAAAAADAAPRRGWLHGIPMAIKDLADVEGLPSTYGSPLFRDHIAPKDCGMVANLRASGAIFIGKTNTPEFGLGSHSFNPVHGMTSNPYNLSRSAGGSSGGAAVALATRMLAVADGSDMMGSLRNPAAWNNVYGFRPTWGLIPPDPRPEREAYLYRLATLGPMARSPKDLAALLQTQVGSDRRLARLDRIDHGSLRNLRLGWLGDWDGAFPMEKGVLETCTAALKDMERAGARVEAVPAPMEAAQLWTSWLRLRQFEIAGLKRAIYDDPDKRAFLKPAALWEVEHGLALSACDVHEASHLRTVWRDVVMTLFEQYDALILPSAQVWPFDKTMVNPTEISGKSMDTYHRWMEVVIPVSLLGLPAISLPAGFGPDGLPMGVQVFGPPDSDAHILQIAQSWHRCNPWPQLRRA
ncbi:MAG: amidase [Pseudoprimorskyibacter sp.]|nr:amidase [Pseudoprimorskyibacter sp.]